MKSQDWGWMGRLCSAHPFQDLLDRDGGAASVDDLVGDLTQESRKPVIGVVEARVLPDEPDHAYDGGEDLGNVGGQRAREPLAGLLRDSRSTTFRSFILEQRWAQLQGSYGSFVTQEKNVATICCLRVLTPRVLLHTKLIMIHSSASVLASSKGGTCRFLRNLRLSTASSVPSCAGAPRMPQRAFGGVCEDARAHALARVGI
eukprot:5324997-Pleurochrysis_carterae.AAC.1